MAKIYQFPDLNPEGYPVFNAEEISDEELYSEEEINRQYEENYKWEEDEYIFNQLMKQEREKKYCFFKRLVRKLFA